MSTVNILKAMATNYASGHQWDHLDSKVCLAVSKEFEQLRRENERLRVELNDGFVEINGNHAMLKLMQSENDRQKSDLEHVYRINAGLADKLIERDKELASAQADNLKLREAMGRDPVHWRVVLVTEIPDGVPIPTARIVGFQCKKEAEQFIAEKKDFKGWEYRLEPLYLSPSDTTALTEYRNGVIEECAKACEATCDDVVADICASHIRTMKEKS